MADKPQWWTKIPIWWPVGVGVILIVLAWGETRWQVQNHLDKEETRQADEEKLQWQAIGELNKHAYRSEEILRFHEQRIENLESR